MEKEGIHDIIEALCNASGFDEMFGRMVLDTFLKQSLEIINDTIKELECMTPEAYEKIANSMHKLKGSSGNVRAFELMEMAIYAEQLAKEKRTEELSEQVSLMSIHLLNYKFELESI